MPLLPDALALLLRRLRSLRGVLPAGQEVLFYLSRLPPPEAGTFGEREAVKGYHCRGQEKEWVGSLKINLQRYEANGTTHHAPLKAHNIWHTTLSII